VAVLLPSLLSRAGKPSADTRGPGPVTASRSRGKLVPVGIVEAIISFHSGTGIAKIGR
jgi:hypothetical protein